MAVMEDELWWCFESGTTRDAKVTSDAQTPDETTTLPSFGKVDRVVIGGR